MGTTSFNLAYVLGGAEISKSILENKLVDVGKAGKLYLIFANLLLMFVLPIQI